jgi:hypothetical protein
MQLSLAFFTKRHQVVVVFIALALPTVVMDKECIMLSMAPLALILVAFEYALGRFSPFRSPKVLLVWHGA